jgi:hypothetical protein
MQTVNNQLDVLAMGNAVKYDSMISLWGFLLPTSGIVMAPILGSFMLNATYHVLFATVSLVTMISALLASIPILEVQYVTMVFVGTLRPMLWTFASGYLGKVFGYSNFGRLYGGLLLIVGMF